MNKSLAILALSGIFMSGPAADLQAQMGPEIKYEERKGFEYDPSVLPPDLGPSPFAPPLPPTGDEDKEAAAKSAPSAPLPSGAIDALSIYPNAPQASMPKVFTDADGPVFNAADVKILKRFHQKTNSAGKLAWDIGQGINGPGLKADQGGRLTGLVFNNMGLEGSLELAEAEKLAVIKSSGNKISGLKLSRLPLLSAVEISGADLPDLNKNFFTDLPALDAITIVDSGLERIEAGAMANLPKLSALRLGDNRIAFLGARSLAGLEKISELSLENNRIAEIQKGALAPLVNLLSLRLDGNRLGSVGSGSFKAQSRLENLRLDNNELERLGAGSFSGLKALKSLNLSHNYISIIEPTIFNGLDNLTEVDLRSNSLPISAMKKIQDSAPGRVHLRLGSQKNVYFGLRAVILSKNDSFTVPAADAAVNGVPSQGRVLGKTPDGAVYTPPEKPGEGGRLKFLKPGLYRLELQNHELSAGAVSVSGYFLVAESHPDLAEATKILGRKELAANLVNSLISKGYVEASGVNPKRMTAIKALFDPRP